jgi:hypothetical protein
MEANSMSRGAKYKFTLKRKPSFETHYCVIRDLVYGTIHSKMKVGEICYSNTPKRILAGVAWNGNGYREFSSEDTARAYLEHRFTTTFLGGGQ